MSNASVPIHVDRFIAKLNGVRPTSNGFEARCPCRNDDNNPSLSIGIGSEDKILITCHRGQGCSVEQVCQAMGVTVKELYPEKKEERKLSLVATYDYRDENGKLLFPQR